MVSNFSQAAHDLRDKLACHNNPTPVVLPSVEQGNEPVKAAGPPAEVPGAREEIDGAGKALPAWLEAHLSVLRQHQQRLAGHVPLGELLQLRISIHSGDFGATSRLSQLIEAHRSYFVANPNEFAAAVTAMLWAQELELAERWIQDCCPPGMRIRLALDESAPDKETVLRLCFCSGSDDAFHKGMLKFQTSATFTKSRFCELHTRRLLQSLPLFASYLASRHFYPGSVLLNLGDAPQLGGLAFCSHLEQSFLIPDHLFIGSGGYQSMKEQFSSQWVPWERRSPVAYWRGATSGGRWAPSVWMDSPRARLCLIARDAAVPGIIDAAISRIGAGVSDEVAAAIREAGIFRDQVPASEFGNYKYNIDIDGNSNSWPGLFVKLCAGGAVLKVASPRGFRQWYYDRLIPWVNFVPIAMDMSDLVDKLQWLRNHDGEASDLGRQARELAVSMTLHSELDVGSRTIADAVRQAQEHGDH